MTAPTPVFQFGTSRFLQAHADLMIGEALARGEAAGPITVLQSSGDQGRAGRLSGLAASEGYRVVIRGLEGGRPVEREQRVRSIVRSLSTARDWEMIGALFVDEARYVISNTGDAGYASAPADAAVSFEQAMSFPAKLQLLLRARFEAGGTPLTVMPLELVRRNGEVLKGRVLELAANASRAYRDWLERDVIWANSLVDRIVSEPLEPAGAVAEPYCLWAIEAQSGLVPPLCHPDLHVVDDIETIEALKLFILNLGHSYLVCKWRTLGQAPATVMEFLEDERIRGDLASLYETEVLPAFVAAGIGEGARAYIATTLERFRNPFLRHKLADIAGNHAAKVERRIVGFLAWAKERGDLSQKPRLSAISAGLK